MYKLKKIFGSNNFSAQFIKIISHYKKIGYYINVLQQTTCLMAVILLPAHPASFAHNFVSGMQSFYFSESQDAIVLQICHYK